MLGGGVELGPQVVGGPHDVLAHAGVGPHHLEQVERPPAVAPPQPVGERLGVGAGAQGVEPHQPGLAVELLAGGLRRLAVPVAQVLLERDAEGLHVLGDLLADVEAVGELAAEDGDDGAAVVALDLVLAAQRGPVGVLLVAALPLDDEWANPGALRDDVVGGERRGQVEAGVDLAEQEVAVLVGDVGERGVDAGVGGADDRPVAHRDDVEEPLGVVEEGEHAVVTRRGEPRHDEVDALGVDDAVRRGEPEGGVEPVDERPDGVDDHAGAGRQLLARVGVAQPAHPAVALPLGGDQLDVVRHGRTGLDGRAHEGEDEPGVVVDEVGVLVLHPTAGRARVDDRLGLLHLLGVEHLRGLGAEQADAPVGGRPERGEPRVVRRGVVEGREEGDLLDVVGVGPHQPVAAAAQAEHQRQLVVLEVLEATPHEVARLLAGEPAEVAAVDERHGGATAREGCGRHRPVDAGPDHEHVEEAAVDPRQVRPSQRHGSSVPPSPSRREEV